MENKKWTVRRACFRPQGKASERRRVEYVSSEEPAFIKRFKQNAGMKPSDTLAEKRAPLERDADDLRDRDDEQPQIVIEYGSGVSEKEAADFVQRTLVRPREETDAKETDKGKRESAEQDQVDDDSTKPASPNASHAKPVFRRPVHRRTNEKTERSKRPEPPPGSAAANKTSSSGLLSFAGEEEEEDDVDDVDNK